VLVNTLLNAEHEEGNQMRKYDVAYVPNGPMSYYPVKDLQDMTLDEIINKYIKTCAKANGSVSVCSKCQSVCREGKRAIQLIANEVYNDPPIPLYGGKTMIEKAREENMKRRQKMEAEKNGTPIEQKREYIKWDGWWEESVASGDQIKWIMTNMGLTRAKAKKKIYQYKWAHGLTKEETVKEKPVEEKQVEEPKTISLDANIETKLNELMKKQESHKKEMDRYMSLYNKEKEAYDAIAHKIDVLCSAIDIVNGN